MNRLAPCSAKASIMGGAAVGVGLVSGPGGSAPQA
jgi:hypothetical protein